VLYNLPYGNTEISVDIPHECSVKVIKQVFVPAAEDEIRLIKKALENPVNSMRLSEIADHGKKTIIIVSDITRFTDSKTAFAAHF